MRLTLALLCLFLLVPASGCVFDCNGYQRKAVWEQNDVPLSPSVFTTEYELGELWGGISRNPDNNKLYLIVYGRDKVSHEELVQFGEALFASKGWPAPQLEGAQESAGCGDDW